MPAQRKRKPAQAKRKPAQRRQKRAVKRTPTPAPEEDLPVDTYEEDEGEGEENEGNDGEERVEETIPHEDSYDPFSLEDDDIARAIEYCFGLFNQVPPGTREYTDTQLPTATVAALPIQSEDNLSPTTTIHPSVQERVQARPITQVASAPALAVGRLTIAAPSAVIQDDNIPRTSDTQLDVMHEEGGAEGKRLRLEDDSTPTEPAQKKYRR